MAFELMFITAYLPQYLDLAICGVSPAVSASALGLIGPEPAAGVLHEQAA